MRRLAWYCNWSEAAPCGYRMNWFQLSTASSVVIEEPEENPPASAAEIKSKATSSAALPAGTLTRNAYRLVESRVQAMVWLRARILSATRSAMGPVGACSPGIHCG